MSFDQLLMVRLMPFLMRNGLKLVEHYENAVTFRSVHIMVSVSHNALDRTNFVEVSRNSASSFAITDRVVAEAFGMDVKIDQVPPECFIDNLLLFFEGPGRLLLQADPEAFDRAEAVREVENDEYNAKLMLSQHLGVLDKAWADKNYAAFIRAIEKMDRGALPPSYLLKYKMAKDRV